MRSFPQEDILSILKVLITRLDRYMASFIFKRFLSEYYKMCPRLLKWPYAGWNTPKPDSYECPERIWRRMPLHLQKMFIGNPEWLRMRWLPQMGADLEDFEEMRTNTPENTLDFAKNGVEDLEDSEYDYEDTDQSFQEDDH